MPERPIFYVHVPKTAGVTLRHLLDSKLQKTKVINTTISGFLLEPLPIDFDAYDLVSGHVPFAVTELYRHRPYIMTFLRDPIDRAMSQFHFVQEFDRSVLSHLEALKQVRAHNLREFVKQSPGYLSDVFSNIATWMFSASAHELSAIPQDEYLTDSDLERAKQNLSACDFVGLYEEFDVSLTHLCQSMGWDSFADVPVLNRTGVRPKREDLDEETHAALLEILRWDLELYEFGKTLFAERTGRSRAIT